MTPKSYDKWLLSILSGAMLTASFAPAKLGWLAWLALVPLLKGLQKEAPSRAFKLGLLAGFIHYVTLIYWILAVLEQYGGLNILLSASVLLILCLYLSLYFALFSYLVSSLRGAPFAALLTASVWVALEFVRAKLLTGFPWCLLGYSQYRYLDLIQISTLFGVYGVSFLIVLSNALIYALFFDRSFQKKGFLRWEVALASVMVFLTLAYGHLRLQVADPEGKGQRSIRAAVVQGNIDQSVKWDPAYQEKSILVYERLTRNTRPFRPDLVVWPETSVPLFFQDRTPFSRRITALARNLGTDLLFGSPAYRQGPAGTSYLNRAYHLSMEGEISGYYDKGHLVPFGEYVPLKRFLPFVHRLVPAAGDFIPGDRTAPLRLSSSSAGVLVCFEVIFPELARQRVEEGAQVLVNLTNDAWFGMTSAPYQHLSMAVFRALENGRPLIRAANTGISAFIGPRGKILDRAGLFTEALLTREVRLSDGRSRTFYTRYGDLFALFLSVISLITFFYVLCYKKSIIRLKV
jgi:apolipoprotein N-acyltransferase